MKQSIWGLSILVFLLTIKTAAFADVGDDFVNNGIRYIIFASGHVGGDGVSACVEPIRNTKYSGNITIPERITHNGKTYVVSMIDQSAFENCVDLQSISLPNTIVEIRTNAFKGCSRIKSIVIPNSVLELRNNVFENATSLISISIGNQIKEIFTNTFAGCASLKSITFPKSIERISSDALKGCTSLEEAIFECCIKIPVVLKGNKSIK